MDSEKCTMCNIEKHMNNFCERYSECKECNRTRGLERCDGNKDKKSKQQKLHYGKNSDRILLQKQHNRCIQIRDLVRSYVELEYKLQALEDKWKINDSEII